MAQKQMHEVTLSKPVHGGACLSHLPDGRAVFVRGGLPGEVVRIRLTSEHKRFAWAEVVEVLEASPDRIPHVWDEAADAFELGHVSPSFQRVWKGQVLDEQLRRIGGDAVVEQIQGSGGGSDSVLVPVEAAPGDTDDEKLFGRRTRLQLVIDKEGRPGLRRYRSHDVTPLTELPLAAAPIADLEVLTDERWRRRWKVGERIAVEAPTASAPVVVTPRGVFTDPNTTVDTPSWWEVTAADRTHRFPVRPGSFWQTHQEAPAVLVEAVLEGCALSPDDVVAELYSGSGLFSRFIMDELGEGELVTLEGNHEAVASAAEVLQEAVNSGSAQLFEGRIDGDAVKELLSMTGRPVTTIVLDPPRSGASKEVIEAIVASTAQRVVLVSCDPAAGARDLADLVEGGFTIAQITAWDLFPHTHHFEIVSVLTR